MYNRAILIGRLVADPELRTTPQGINVARVRLAVDRAYTPKGGDKKSDFLSIVCWRQQAEFVSKYFSKGRLMGVEGSIQSGDYTDKEGNKRFTTEIAADRVFFVESKGSAAVGGASESSHPEPAMGGVSYQSGSTGDFQVVDDDDLPF